MMLFFTSVGFQSDFKVLKRGGKPLLVMIGLVVVLIIMQNLISVGISRGLGMDALFGMAAGSIPMSGGHGTSGGFSPLLEKMGLTGASSITMAAATFGLVAGSLLGGPLGAALLTACFMRNLFGLSPAWEKELCIGEVVSIGDICLQLFLGMAMASLRLGTVVTGSSATAHPCCPGGLHGVLRGFCCLPSAGPKL